MSRTIRLMSWNVNGMRAVLKKGFTDFLESASPDLLCIQETKMGRAAIEKEALSFPGYTIHWNPAERPGYSGTATLVRDGLRDLRPLNRGFGRTGFDAEGRIQSFELPGFFLVNAYFPNANHELSRLSYKIDFNDYLLRNLRRLEKKKPVILCGDFNVAHEEIDLARPKENRGNAGFTDEERAWMTKFLRSGFRDTFRAVNGDRVQYSWWSYRAGARRKNIGWRIDYFCVSERLLERVRGAAILDGVMGSDHCPVSLEIAA